MYVYKYFCQQHTTFICWGHMTVAMSKKKMDLLVSGPERGRKDDSLDQRSIRNYSTTWLCSCLLTVEMGPACRTIIRAQETEARGKGFVSTRWWEQSQIRLLLYCCYIFPTARGHQEGPQRYRYGGRISRRKLRGDSLNSLPTPAMSLFLRENEIPLD